MLLQIFPLLRDVITLVPSEVLTLVVLLGKLMGKKLFHGVTTMA